MPIAILNESEKRNIEWVNPNSEVEVTLEEYRLEMKVAENSGFISLDKHRKNMQKWLSEKLMK